MNETYNSTTDNGWKAWNQWHLNVLEEEVTNVWFFFLVIFASGIWLIYLTFYNSRNAMSFVLWEVRISALEFDPHRSKKIHWMDIFKSDISFL